MTSLLRSQLDHFILCFGRLSFGRIATRAGRLPCMVALGGRASARPSFCGVAA